MNKCLFSWPDLESTEDWDLVLDDDGVWHWEKREEENTKEQINVDYPDVCPRCKAPAYQGLNSWDCSKCGKF